jgi:hypothetical protein
VRVGGTRTLRYLSLAPSEIVCESDLRPEIGFNCPKLEEEERFRYSNRRAAGLQIRISKIKIIAFHHCVFAAFITTPKAMFDDLTIAQTREKINENTAKPLDKMSV